jgi:hypothetical protein
MSCPESSRSRRAVDVGGAPGDPYKPLYYTRTIPFAPLIHPADPDTRRLEQLSARLRDDPRLREVLLTRMPG